MRIQEVAQRWRKVYEPFKDKDFKYNGKSKQQIALELDALDPNTATAKDVEDIIGNTTWTKLRCDECEQEVDAVVEVGEEPTYESSTARLCKGCLQKAVALWPKRKHVDMGGLEFSDNGK